jgi:hypothetical protein
VPFHVAQKKDTVPRREPGPLHLVRFFDKTNSWYVDERTYARLRLTDIQAMVGTLSTPSAGRG